MSAIELHLVGDRIVFHKYRVDFEVPKPPERLEPREVRGTLWWRFMDKLRMYRVEPYGILCDSDAELEDITSKLKELGLSYKVTDISPTPEQLARAQEIEGKVGSRTEALNYILYNQLPERLRIEKEIEDLKRRVENLEKRR